MSNKLSDSWYTGDPSKGNPFDGDVSKGMDFDMYESYSPVVNPSGSPPSIIGPYRCGAVRLLNHSHVKPGDSVLNLGSRTGMAPLELFSRQPNILVLSLDSSEGMTVVSKYKFNQSDREGLLANVNDKSLLEYWDNFREESKPYRDKVEFLRGELEIVNLQDESFDSAIASQYMHWTNSSNSLNLFSSFRHLGRILKNRGEVLWNSSSHFFNDLQFPAAEFGFRYNYFMASVLDRVSAGGGVEFKDLFSLSRPEHNLESIRTITSDQGFDTEQVGIYIMLVDFVQFVSRHVPSFIKNNLIVSREINDQELESRINESIGKAILDPRALGDTKHRYEIWPVFRSVKKY